MKNCETCKRCACAYAGTDDPKRAETCPIGYKAGPGKPNPPGHKVTEATHLPGFTPPTDVDLAKAAKQDAYLKR